MEPEIYASHLDIEPLVYKGATTSEIFMLLKIVPLASALVGFLAGLLINGIEAAILGMVVSAIFLSMIAVWIFASVMTSLKFAKPDGYVLQWLSIKLHSVFGFNLGFVRKNAVWSNVRK